MGRCWELRRWDSSGSGTRAERGRESEMGELPISTSAAFQVFLAVLRRPSLWRIAMVVALRLAEPGWWRRSPFLPLPPADYLRFRLLTNYGSEAPTGDSLADDVISYLRWCRDR